MAEQQQQQQQLTSDERITAFFTKWNAERLLSYFSEATKNLLDFSRQVIMICLNDISHHNPAHLINPAMNACFKKFPEWSQHIAAGNRALVWKLMHNGTILWHQCMRFEWYKNADDDDKTFKELTTYINKDDNGQSLMNYLISMYICLLSDNIFYCFMCAFCLK